MKAFDYHCNMNHEFIMHLLNLVEDDRKPIAEFSVDTADTIKALSYLLPTCKFDIVGDDTYLLYKVAEYHKDIIDQRSESNRIKTFEWDISYGLSRDRKNYHLGFTENYLSYLPQGSIASIWHNMSAICDNHAHLVSLSKDRPCSFYTEALFNGTPPVKHYKLKTFDNNRRMIIETNYG